jgi:hypothetical protein
MIHIAPAYRRARSSVLIQQAVVLLLAGMNLDGGDILNMCLVALAGFWVGAVIICVRRPQTPSRFDLLFIRFASFPLCILAVLLTLSVWRWKGLLR